VGAPARAPSGAGASGTGFEILGFGDLTVPMDAHGGRPELAPYPDWTAEFLVHGTAAERAYVLRHGELAGSWGVPVRHADGSLPTLDSPGAACYRTRPRSQDPGHPPAGLP